MKILVITVLLLLMALPLLAATPFWDAAQPVLIDLGKVVSAILVVPLLIKLSRKWGLDIDETLANDAINALINIVVNTDLEHKEKTGLVKKRISKTIAESVLTNAQYKILIKKYGSLDAAIQVAFERSSLNGG